MRLVRTVETGRVAAVVKADAYGLGAKQVVEALLLEGCRDFFVAEFSEALSLVPTLQKDARLFVLNGLQPGNETLCAERDIIPVANCVEQLRRWCETAATLQKALPVVLQFDTGMSRLGFALEEAAAVRSHLSACPLVKTLFVMSHLASADEAESQQNQDQLAQIAKVGSAFPGTPVCFANSAGSFLGAAYHGTMVRPGIALYGGNDCLRTKSAMEPVVRLEVGVIQTRTVGPGTRIGYSGTYVAEHEMRLATIAAGYADGLPRSLSNKGTMFFQGHRLPMVGRVSMDSIIVDITALPDDAVQPGSLVEILGPHQTIDDLATAAGTISYEILTSLGSRYSRLYC